MGPHVLHTREQAGSHDRIKSLDGVEGRAERITPRSLYETERGFQGELLVAVSQKAARPNHRSCEHDSQKACSRTDC